MKHLLLITLSMCLGIMGLSQTYNMGNGNVSTCSGTFYDNGGSGGNYANNSNNTYTICSNNPAFKMQLLFTAFDTESGFDELCIYDGNSTGSPLLGCFSGTSLNGQSILASGSCLTFNFTSDGSVNRPGWAATIYCKAPCQAITPIISSVTPAPVGADNDIQLCLGGQVQLSGSANFPQNNTYYAQSLASSTFKWFIGGGLVQTGQNANITYNNSGRNGIFLVVEDTQGCTDTVKVGRASVALKPNFSDLTFVSNDTICLEEDVTISMAAKPNPINVPPMGVAGTTFLPDGSGISYTSSIAVNSFDPAAVFQAGFLDEVFMDIEHSYLGDLEMTIICPNNQRATLKEYPGGGGTHLGEPIDVGASTAPGVGYVYSFNTVNPTYSTMTNESGNYQYSYTDILGNPYVNQSYLPAGSYEPFNDINGSLIGCPLNGNWTLEVTDHLTIDDGYIFSWGMNFNQMVLPDTSANSVLPTITSKSWTPDPSITANPDDSTITVLPLTAGNHNYTFNVTDSWGCSHDTTVEIHVKARPKSNAGLDDNTCNLDYILNPTPTATAINPSWTYYSVSGTGTANFTGSSSTIYASNPTVDEYSQFSFILKEEINGCETYPDTVLIDFIQLINTIDISVDNDTVCLPNSVNFANNSDMSQFSQIDWELGDGNTSNDPASVNHIYDNAGCYDLKITLTSPQGCTVDSILTDFVCAYDVPTADFTFLPFEPIVPETTVDFTNTSIGNNLNSLWDFAGLGSSTVYSPTYSFPNTDGDTYPVTLTVENEAGCLNSITKLVVIKNPLIIYIPNAFSPNGDGENDTWKPVFTNEDLSNFSIRIFNRWGENMFYSEDINFSWNGRFKDLNVPIGIYSYEIRWKELNDTEDKRKIGHITILD